MDLDHTFSPPGDLEGAEILRSAAQRRQRTSDLDVARSETQQGYPAYGMAGTVEPLLPERGARPSVAVVMATYNGERFLGEQLESLASQHLQPDQVVIVDDGSTDGTPGMLHSFARRAPFPVNLRRREHQGTGSTFGESMLATDADIIVICDQDDVWIPEKLSVLVDRMERHPDALLAFSDAVLIDADGRRIGGSRWRVAGFGECHQAIMPEDPFGVLLSRQVVSGCTAAIRKELLPAVLPFPAGVHPALGDIMYDRWISLVAAAAGPILPIPERLVSYRIHDGQQVGIPALRLRRFAPQTALRFGQFLPSRDTRLGRFDYHLAHLAEIEKRLEYLEMDMGESSLRLRLAGDHLRARRRLSSMSRTRLRPIAQHYLDEDGYRRYALGISSALSDWTR